MTTFGTAVWHGGLKDGKGAISTKSGALNAYPYGFASRFEGKPGTNPEELIGAAHAGCFTMALSLILGEAGFTADEMNTRADVTLEKLADGFAITKVHLTLSAKIPGCDKAKFDELAAKAKAGCPVSKLSESGNNLGRVFGLIPLSRYAKRCADDPADDRPARVRPPRRLGLVALGIGTDQHRRAIAGRPQDGDIVELAIAAGAGLVARPPAGWKAGREAGSGRCCRRSSNPQAACASPRTRHRPEECPSRFASIAEGVVVSRSPSGIFSVAFDPVETRAAVAQIARETASVRPDHRHRQREDWRQCCR